MNQVIRTPSNPIEEALEKAFELYVAEFYAGKTFPNHRAIITFNDYIIRYFELGKKHGIGIKRTIGYFKERLFELETKFK